MRLIASRVDFRNARPNLNLCRRVYNPGVAHLPGADSKLNNGERGEG